MPDRVPILTYHSIDDSGTVISTPPVLFERQMRALAEAGWTTAPLSEVAAALRTRRPLPRRTVVLTFDDGYENFRDRAWPVLRSHGFGATLFAPAAPRVPANDWDRGAGTMAGAPLLDGPALRRLADEGVEIGCHSATHARLDRTRGSELEREVAGAQRALAETLARPVTLFAYPYGAYDAAARAAVAACYDAACSTHLGFASAASDVFRLERIDAYYLRDPAMLARLDDAAMRRRLALRALLRRARSRFG
jgi:peptidoglycan/xylan/chitin deacetylase (PgdA/CDA1 family)